MKSRTITGWKVHYVDEQGASAEVLENFGDDIASAMKSLLEEGNSPAAAYKIVTDGLYADADEHRAYLKTLAENRSRRGRRASRRASGRRR
jgi:hypothetical protein